MAMLYGYKWTSVNGEEFDERSHAGQVWINKTADLDNDDWFKAVDRCEKEIREKTKTGDECWPPNYEEFVTYARESRNAAHRLFKPSLPEPKEVKAARKERGKEHCRRLLSIFDE